MTRFANAGLRSQPADRSKWIMLLGVLDRDPAQRGKLVYCRCSTEAPVTTRFYAAEWHLRLIGDCGPVDVTDA